MSKESHIAAQLRGWRGITGLSQEATARRAGISIHTIQSWEQGRRVPIEHLWRKGARGYGVPVAMFKSMFRREDDENEA